jgi:hypothetical protein
VGERRAELAHGRGGVHPLGDQSGEPIEQPVNLAAHRAPFVHTQLELLGTLLERGLCAGAGARRILQRHL